MRLTKRSYKNVLLINSNTGWLQFHFYKLFYIVSVIIIRQKMCLLSIQLRKNCGVIRRWKVFCFGFCSLFLNDIGLEYNFVWKVFEICNHQEIKIHLEFKIDKLTFSNRWLQVLLRRVTWHKCLNKEIRLFLSVSCDLNVFYNIQIKFHEWRIYFNFNDRINQSCY